MDKIKVLIIISMWQVCRLIIAFQKNHFLKFWSESLKISVKSGRNVSWVKTEIKRERSWDVKGVWQVYQPQDPDSTWEKREQKKSVYKKYTRRKVYRKMEKNNALKICL